jgi:hypothetical protein
LHCRAARHGERLSQAILRLLERSFLVPIITLFGAKDGKRLAKPAKIKGKDRHHHLAENNDRA